MIEGPGLHYDPDFLGAEVRAEVVAWLRTIHPLWEERHAPRRGLRDGQKTRRLLRPVYWLGGWQFACLNYFHRDHPRGRVVEAEPMPPVLQSVVNQIEQQAHATFEPADVPDGWCLNTCLINLYGLTERDGRWIDTARVGGHHDHEPGPVASLSLGARARFQFTTRATGPDDEGVVAEQWLGDGSLLIFGTRRWKREVFHRVPRVERRGFDLGPAVEGFRIRRVNFTFRYVPPEHIHPLSALGAEAREDVTGYVQTLAEHAPFFADALHSVRRNRDG